MQRPIATLNLPSYKIKDLHNKGFILCSDVNIENDTKRIGISIDDWKELNSCVETKTAIDLCEDETICNNIVTFSSALDDLLGGGVPLKMITEFYGLPGTGKTQMCLQLCASVQMPDCFGGIEGHAVYIDTYNGFTSHRLSDIAKGCISYCNTVANTYNSFEMLNSLQHITEDNILKGVHCLSVVTFIELLSVVTVFKKLLIKDPQIKLLVIDSITKPIKHTNLEYFERIKIIYTFLSELQQLASLHKFAIVVSNDMTTKFDEFGNSYETPCLGDSFGHRMNNRIMLERKSDLLFNATFVKNVLKQQSTVPFMIVESGIRDVLVEENTPT